MLRSLALAILLFAVVPAYGVEHQYVRAYHPLENERYAESARIGVAGHVYRPGGEGADGLTIRVRLYRPSDGKLTTEDEVTEELSSHPSEDGVLLFATNLNWKRKKLEPGQYAVRVDCLRQTDTGTEMVASQSVFIEVVRRRDKREPRPVTSINPFRTRVRLPIAAAGSSSSRINGMVTRDWMAPR